ncbi:hypothetical protein GCM10023311_12290 [Flaviramulus aquimarinus]|uniref:Lipoprotein n=1 Tax=Flaviramulus aquimarinus TaxID=1170456 RepID=A0ABP9EZ18_9FLAO
MKFLFIILSLVFLDNSCSSSKINQDAIVLEYSASSRSFYKKITVNRKAILTVNKRDNSPISNTCSSNNWDTLIKKLESIDVQNIANLEAPSKDFLFDGAAMARLKIIYNGTTYETQPFDHGKPHENIAALVKEMLSISENIE